MTDTEYSEMFDRLREADARIAELEAELASLESCYTVVQAERYGAESRLAAVIALCDSDLYGDAGSMFAHDVRAAATGETK